jgi:hypothetical protein
LNAEPGENVNVNVNIDVNILYVKMKNSIMGFIGIGRLED